MKAWSLHLMVLICFSLLCISNEVLAKGPLKDSSQQQELSRALDFLKSLFKNDSANIILTELLVELEVSNELDTPFGLKVQVRKAEALEKDNKDDAAIQLLLHVVETSQLQKEWDVFVLANLTLARPYEKNNYPEKCLKSLRLSHNAIDHCKWGSIYPRFSIRVASYPILFSYVVSELYYMKEVLRTVPLFNLKKEEAVGHLLMGLLTGNTSYEPAVRHFQIAGKRWMQIEDFSGYSAIHSNISKLHLENKNPELALVYNDSSLLASKKAYELVNGYGTQIYFNEKKN